VFIAVRRVGADRILGGMTSPYWPLSGLRVRTPDLELRWPSLADLDALAGLAAEGVHDAGVQPFTVPWTDAPPCPRADRGPGPLPARLRPDAVIHSRQGWWQLA
jgi:hypothetical protein